MEPEGSLPHSQASATCPCPRPAESSQHTHIPPPGDPSQYYPPIYAQVSSVVSFPPVSPPRTYMSPSPHPYAPHALISQIYFWNKTLHVSDSSSFHHQEFFTVHKAMVHVIQVCWTACEQFGPDTARELSANLYDIYRCCVYSEKLLMMDRGTVRNM